MVDLQFEGMENMSDLHQHLGSSSTANFLWELAHQQGIKLPEKDYWKFMQLVRMDSSVSFEEYVTRFFEIPERIQSSPYAVERSVHHAISYTYRKANAKLIEIRFNPMLRNRGGEHDLDKIILASVIGMKKAVLEYPVSAGIILMMDRRFSKTKNEVIVDKAIKFHKDGIVGIDLGGPNSEKFNYLQIADAVAKAKEAGLGVTVHTGESTPAEDVWSAVEILQHDRIGHGVRASDDAKLMKYLAKKNIVLEVCPTSNLRVKFVKDLKDMKRILHKFMEYDVKFTINSDNPQLLQTNVSNEMDLLYKNGILNKQQIEQCLKNSVEASFIRL